MAAPTLMPIPPGLQKSGFRSDMIHPFRDQGTQINICGVLHVRNSEKTLKMQNLWLEDCHLWSWWWQNSSPKDTINFTSLNIHQLHARMNTKAPREQHYLALSLPQTSTPLPSMKPITSSQTLTTQLPIVHIESI